tara:strand:- start:388 stop:1116 length:729 start_codon:yes stop_codon:yes gene_type:complete
MDKRSVGIRSIIPTTRSPEEIRSDELEEFYKNDIEGKTYTPRITPEIDTLELPSINLTQLESSKETKDKAINSYLTRPPDNIKKMVEKNMPILTYIDKVSNIYDGKPRQYDDQGKSLNNDKTVKQLEALKKFGENPYIYKSKLDTLVEKEEQHPQEKYYEDRINEIQKRGQSWLVKTLDKQDQQKEVQRLKGIVEQNAKRRRTTDQYGNLESATDRIQDQDRKKAEIEIRNKSKTNKEIKNV